MHIFPFIERDPFGPERDDVSYFKDCLDSHECVWDSRGIKGSTILSKLKYYKNPAASTKKDYMHSVLEGVVKRFFKLFEEKVDKSLHIEKNFSLTKSMHDY